MPLQAALWNTRLPKVVVLFNEEAEEHDVELSEEWGAVEGLQLEDKAPLLLTVAKIGAANVLDPTEEEGRVS